MPRLKVYDRTTANDSLAAKTGEAARNALEQGRRSKAAVVVIPESDLSSTDSDDSGTSDDAVDFTTDDDDDFDEEVVESGNLEYRKPTEAQVLLAEDRYDELLDDDELFEEGGRALNPTYDTTGEDLVEELKIKSVSKDQQASPFDVSKFHSGIKAKKDEQRRREENKEYFESIRLEKKIDLDADLQILDNFAGIQENLNLTLEGFLHLLTSDLELARTSFNVIDALKQRGFRLQFTDGTAMDEDDEVKEYLFLKLLTDPKTVAKAQRDPAFHLFFKTLESVAESIKKAWDEEFTFNEIDEKHHAVLTLLKDLDSHVNITERLNYLNDFSQVCYALDVSPILYVEDYETMMSLCLHLLLLHVDLIGKTYTEFRTIRSQLAEISKASFKLNANKSEPDLKIAEQIVKIWMKTYSPRRTFKSIADYHFNDENYEEDIPELFRFCKAVAFFRRKSSETFKSALVKKVVVKKIAKTDNEVQLYNFICEIVCGNFLSVPPTKEKGRYPFQIVEEFNKLIDVIGDDSDDKRLKFITKYGLYTSTEMETFSPIYNEKRPQSASELKVLLHKAFTKLNKRQKDKRVSKVIQHFIATPTTQDAEDYDAFINCCFDILVLLLEMLSSDEDPTLLSDRLIEKCSQGQPILKELLKEYAPIKRKLETDKETSAKKTKTTERAFFDRCIL